MLKFQYFEVSVPDVKATSLEKTLMPGKIEGKGKGGDRGGDGWMSLTQWT